MARARALSSERVILVGPDVYLADGTVGGGCMAAAALAGLLAAQTDPVCTQVGLMNDVTLQQNLWYLRQNAAVDIMNRAGLKDKTAEDQEIRITFGADGGTGLAAGMPPSDDEE